MFKKISIIIPVYNEQNTIEECLNRVLKANVFNFEKEYILKYNTMSPNRYNVAEGGWSGNALKIKMN